MQSRPCANRSCSRQADEYGRHAMACNGKATVRHDSTQNLLLEDFRAYGLSASNRPSGHRFTHILDLEVGSTVQPGKTWLEFYIPDPTLDSRMHAADQSTNAWKDCTELSYRWNTVSPLRPNPPTTSSPWFGLCTGTPYPTR